jgi:hypothetical protein
MVWDVSARLARERHRELRLVKGLSTSPRRRRSYPGAPAAGQLPRWQGGGGLLRSTSTRSTAAASLLPASHLVEMVQRLLLDHDELPQGAPGGSDGIAGTADVSAAQDPVAPPRLEREI